MKPLDLRPIIKHTGIRVKQGENNAKIAQNELKKKKR